MTKTKIESNVQLCEGQGVVYLIFARFYLISVDGKRAVVATFGDKKNNMDPITLTVAGAGLLSSIGGGIFGNRKAKKAAARQRELLRQQRAANDAWYARNYFQDYLNSTEAQNAIRRTKEAWGDRMKEARGRQAITGGTPEQVNQVQEIGAEAMGNTIANLAAQSSAIKRNVDAQKQQMDSEVLAQEGQIAAAEHEAGRNLTSNAISTGVAALQLGLQGIGNKPAETTTTESPAAPAATTESPATTTEAKPTGMMGARVNGQSVPTITTEPRTNRAWYDDMVFYRNQVKGKPVTY